MSSTSGARGRSRALIAVGLVVIILSIIGAAVLYVLGQRQADESVRRLARAPVGCDTTLEFTETGTFVLFIETTGRVDGLAGGCDVQASYQRDARPSRLSVELVDPDGVELSLDRTDETRYDNDGFVASSFRQVEIAESGRHVVRVTSPERDFVVSIGRDPGAISQSFVAGALAAGVFGTIAGAAITAVGIVRRRGAVGGSHARGPVAGAPPPGDAPFGPAWGGPRPTAPPTAPPQTPPPPGAPLAPPGAPATPSGPPPSPSSGAQPPAGLQGGRSPFAPPGGPPAEPPSPPDPPNQNGEPWARPPAVRPGDRPDHD